LEIFCRDVFSPRKRSNAELIQSKIYLVEEDELPDSWKLFLDHQMQLQILHSLWKDQHVSSNEIIGKGWPQQFEPDVKRGLSRLRSEYNMFARRLKLAPIASGVLQNL
jgi:hypothetical protein